MELQLHYLNNKSQFLIGKVEQNQLIEKGLYTHHKPDVSIPYR